MKKNIVQTMPNFLSDIDEKFNSILKQKSISKKDLIHLKTFVIECYENDNVIDLIELHKSMKLINMDDDSDN
jgi:hypothetical protein